ncbi:type I-G CRISPR-associated protein Csb2 [Coraliomargarita sp. W4R53]
MFALGLHYLSGYAAATEHSDRNRAEWPPHPARIFMALAAGYFETEPTSEDSTAFLEWEEEANALRWLENLPSPALHFTEGSRRSVLDVYVPPNDMAVSKKTVIPAFRSNRQPRTFPKVHLADPNVYLIWQDNQAPETYFAALERLCRKVIRVGHSSSMVQMWIPQPEQVPEPTVVPNPNRHRAPSTCRLRVAGRGTLEYLKSQYNAEASNAFFSAVDVIQTAKGKQKKTLEAEFEQKFGMPYKRNLNPPPSLRPTISTTTDYVPVNENVEIEPATTFFSEQLLILTKEEGPNLGLEATWQLSTALRGAIEKHCQPTPEWISGHKPEGKPSESPHLAILPLAFVGQEYADGHIMGMALALPKDIEGRERSRALSRLLYSPDGENAEVTLTLGKLGVWTLKLEERVSPPRTLRGDLIVGGPAGSTTWASVTPMVLDRHPKKDPRTQRAEWFEEVTNIIVSSCKRIGLPKPEKIDLDTTSWHKGAPRSKPGSNGFPLMPARPGGSSRSQIHVWLQFAVPVIGPVLLGSGRYRGYGLCKPMPEIEAQTKKTNNRQKESKS